MQAVSFRASGVTAVSSSGASRPRSRNYRPLPKWGSSFSSCGSKGAHQMRKRQNSEHPSSGLDPRLGHLQRGCGETSLLQVGGSGTGEGPIRRATCPHPVSGTHQVGSPRGRWRAEAPRSREPTIPCFRVSGPSATLAAGVLLSHRSDTELETSGLEPPTPGLQSRCSPS